MTLPGDAPIGRAAPLHELLVDHPDRPRPRAQEVQPGDLLDGGEELRLEHRVHDHHEARLLPQPLLHDGLDRGAVLAEHERDLREHAGPVGDLHVQVEGATRCRR